MAPICSPHPASSPTPSPNPHKLQPLTPGVEQHPKPQVCTSGAEQRPRKHVTGSSALLSEGLGPNLNEHFGQWLYNFHDLYKSSTLIK